MKKRSLRRFIAHKRLMLATRKEVLKEFTKITMIANLNIREVLKTLEGMEQNKLYFLCLDEWDYLDQVAIQDAFARAKNDLKWTSPKILFINKKVDKLTEEESKQLRKKLQECE